jgi:hypothetical protein
VGFGWNRLALLINLDRSISVMYITYRSGLDQAHERQEYAILFEAHERHLLVAGER